MVLGELLNKYNFLKRSVKGTAKIMGICCTPSHQMSGVKLFCTV